MTISKQPAPTCRVVTQYQSGGEKVFELATADTSLELRISSRTLDGERRWHVAVQQGSSPEISDEAETKRGALSKVAAQWAEQGLPILDWTAVETALLAVRGV